MIARRVALLAEVTVASPGYLARHGTPATPDDLAGHRMVGFHSTATGGVLPLQFIENGRLRLEHLPASISVNSAESFNAAARQGLGLIQMPLYNAQRFIGDGSLVRVLDDFPPTPTPVSLLYPRSRQLSPRLRVFLDWIARVFSAHTAGGPLAGDRD